MKRRATVTKEKVLDVTGSTIGRFGVRKTTLEDVARSAGVSKAAVLYHFHSKEELIAAVIDREHQQVLAMLREAVAAEATAEGKLRAFAVLRFRYITERLRAYGDVTREIVESVMPLVRASQVRYREQELEILRGILAGGMAVGELASGDPDLMAVAAVAALSGIYEAFILYDRGDRLVDGVEQLYRLLMDGLRRR